MINKYKLAVPCEIQDKKVKEDDVPYPIFLSYSDKDAHFYQETGLKNLNEVIDTYLHNNGQRLTMIIRGKCAYTFEMPK